jgi:hypothetical protein
MEQQALKMSDVRIPSILLLKDIWRSKVLIYIEMLFIFSTPVLIRNLWQLKAVAFPAFVPNMCYSIAPIPSPNFAPIASIDGNITGSEIVTN